MNGIIPLDDYGAEKIGPISCSDIEIVPGFFEKMEQLSDLSDSDLLNLDPSIFSSIFSSDELARLYIDTKILWSETFTYGVMAGNKTYVEFYKEGAFQRLRDRIRSVVVKNSWEEEGNIIISELHCPKINKCKAYYTHKTVNSNDNFIKVTILGFGGGSQASFSTGIGHRIPAKEECIQILKPLKLRIEECDSSQGEFTRIQIIDIKKRELNVQPIPPHLDKCKFIKQDLKNKLWDIIKINARHSDEPRTEWCNVEEGKLSNFQVSLNFGALSFDLRVSTQALKSCNYEYKLFGPMEYYAYTLPELWGYYWTW